MDLCARRSTSTQKGLSGPATRCTTMASKLTKDVRITLDRLGALPSVQMHMPYDIPTSELLRGHSYSNDAAPQSSHSRPQPPGRPSGYKTSKTRRRQQWSASSSRPECNCVWPLRVPPRGALRSERARACISMTGPFRMPSHGHFFGPPNRSRRLAADRSASRAGAHPRPPPLRHTARGGTRAAARRARTGWRGEQPSLALSCEASRRLGRRTALRAQRRPPLGPQPAPVAACGRAGRWRWRRLWTRRGSCASGRRAGWRSVRARASAKGRSESSVHSTSAARLAARERRAALGHQTARRCSTASPRGSQSGCART